MSVPRRLSMAGALAMAAALGVGTVGAAPTMGAPSQQAPVREYVAPDRQRQTRRRKKKAKNRAPQKSEPWQFGKNGDAIDGRGDYRSAKRLLRQQLCAKYGITTGRQWVRLRRALRRIQAVHEARKAA